MDTASASRSWFNSSCFLSATETRSAWSIAQLLYVVMETFVTVLAYADLPNQWHLHLAIEISACRTMTGAMATDEIQIPLAEQLEEIGAQLDWVRGYL